RLVEQELPTEGTVDAVHDELVRGLGDAVELVGAGEARLIDGRDAAVLEIDRDFHRDLDASDFSALLAVAVWRAGAHGLEFAMERRDRLLRRGVPSGSGRLRVRRKACRDGYGSHRHDLADAIHRTLSSALVSRQLNRSDVIFA